MKLPRDLSGSDLAKGLAQFGYTITRQKGSHMRLTTQLGGEHHVTIPCHGALRVGTLRSVLDMVATHVGISREELQQRLWG
jgi:predicted RNA binding protein YcfA (HicA-like mRNA interferase family)